MKFIKKVKVNGGYHTYSFSSHEADSFIIGDQLWSNGLEIDVYESIDDDVLWCFIESVENKRDFIAQLYKDNIL